MLRLIPAVSIGFFVLINGRQSLSQTNDSDLSQFDRNWTAASAFAPAANLHVKYHELLYPTLTNDEFAQLQATVANKPDHPDKRILDAEIRRRAKGNDRVDYEVWFSRSGNWRYNLTDHGQELYVDTIVTPDIIWSLIPQALTVIPPGPNAPPNKNYGQAETTIVKSLKEFHWGKLGLGRPGLFSAQSANITQDQWTGIATSADGVKWRGAGRVIPESRRFILEKGELLEAPKAPQEQGKTEEYKDWQFSETVKDWICLKIEERSADGRLIKVRVLDSINPLDLQSFGDLTKVPLPNGDDIARGRMHFTSMIDFRPNAEKMITFSPDGATETPLPPTALGHARSGQMRTIGWILLGAIILALFSVRLLRQRASRTHVSGSPH